MPLAVYVKENTFDKIQVAKRRDRVFFGLITIIGLTSVIFAIWPYFVWQTVTRPRLSGGVNDFPIPKAQVLSSKSTLSASIQVIQDPDGFSYFIPTTFSKEEEGNKPSYFIPTTFSKEEASESSSLVQNYRLENKPSEFSLTIPRLKIARAKVKVDSLDFYKSLAHFPGSALPGEIGNSFITGHSVLPQFNDPKNYRAIFTKLSDLEVGDDVFVEIEGQKLHFTVQYLRVVDPRDTSVINPISPAGRNLTLMTCVPPGTNLKRLVVVTSLI
ncbi:hypothetical protein A2697_04655 [Candidatus Curtissbacteria bacterium RIFCSPHIGHO2_01_FULL_41_44]|uniref:Sortase n=1 Tax=Candidatus Curtissbacteria bacterium RIFCSPLOWO2_01_FULL_42_50 TaxID=1797730 RepID=A0A1F5H2R4_9BACT|nr:MAG: hypothetical protein A3C33_01765 [Candidatus Curtissbacteria bacterium RIFCSPHIGHO2_02_FULL_42_58]OGD94782.1 MAG: hypothetical protein A2697_04655 [Candidatus Curtissbacteria bacterium RIFCSPHIGHO2_01_FULL_41_44]OGD96326.1 MAG: hypothetical protein A3E71_02120 [Candidatus Curtissbacteria bacterium RIFCSPHIGHO2_12_FULL_42_33]OGD98345.1 MAG: hypothetical protein A3B54_00635 [Candidatus Curtissbacteria bacterium RIFCSPLOWO2_01_FULL_42_50]OGE02982.1 MAG: hypothetical protein A3G16_04625 [Ca